MVAMSASLPAASANVHQEGANSSRTIRPRGPAPPRRAPPPARAVPRSRRGSRLRRPGVAAPSARTRTPILDRGSTRPSSGLSGRGSYPSTARQNGVTAVMSVAPGMTSLDRKDGVLLVRALYLEGASPEDAAAALVDLATHLDATAIQLEPVEPQSARAAVRANLRAETITSEETRG